MAATDPDTDVTEALEARDSAIYHLNRLEAAIAESGSDRLLRIYTDYREALAQREETLGRLLM